MSISGFRVITLKLVLALLLVLGGCGTKNSSTTDLPQQRDDGTGKMDSSLEAVFLDFKFSGTLYTGSSWGSNKQIENQLLYTIGQLNGDKSVSRLDKVELTDVKTEQVESGYKVTYTAKLLVAWGKKNDVPETYTFILPRDMSYDGLERFTESYSHDCVDWGAHDVTPNSMWYYYRPAAYNCKINDEHVVKSEATVTLSEINTTGKYPEYHKIWEDNELRVVAIFGKYEDGATSNSDPGISAYNGFVTSTIALLKAHSPNTVPAEVTSTPGVANPDVTISATLPDGKKVEVVVLLIDGVRTADATFDERYSSITGKADFIAYNGHSGLGANIRALARKGKWETGQYQIVFMNGCDTYAYVDSALADAHIEKNPDDLKGTKYLDIITNAMPSPSRLADENTLAIFKELLNFSAPKTYQEIFKGIGKSQVVLVSGEEDNVYHPGYDPNPPTPEEWAGLSESGNVEKDKEVMFETVVLEPGRYLFKLDGGGDADLYVRIGERPSTDLYDCRPYRYGSKESCQVDINSPTKIYIVVRGWDDSSDFTLNGSSVDVPQ